MNRKFYKLFCATAFLVMIFIMPVTFAQDPPHPPQSGHGVKGNQSPGGTARIGDGVSILIAFVIGYAYHKARRKKKVIENLDESHNEE
jgi:hypothetical protein